MTRPSGALRAMAVALATAALIVGATCGGEDASERAPTATPATSLPPAASSIAATATELPTQGAATSPALVRSLPARELRLPTAAAFGQPGFREVFVDTHALPPKVDTTAGVRLVLRLWDVGRTQETCSLYHPLSGCATVDWSDFEGRPGVPPGGVFENSLPSSWRRDHTHSFSPSNAHSTTSPTSTLRADRIPQWSV